MKISLPLLSLLLVGLGCAVKPLPPQVPEAPFTIPQAERWELSNGLAVYFIPNPELPLVQGTFMYRGGSYYEDIPGLAAAAGDQIRDGSVSGIAADDLDRRLDNLGASIESSGGDELGTVSFSCLSEDIEQVFGLFAGVLRTPAFDDGRLQLWRSLAADGIRRRRDDPGIMAEMAFADLVYGRESFYAREATLESVARISRADLSRYHAQFVRPNGSAIVVTGDLSREQLTRLLETRLGSWARTETPIPALSKPTLAPQPGIYVLERDFEQASVVIGHLGPPRFNADQYSLAVFSRYFGTGGFGNLLFSRIRSQLGLAYDVGGGFTSQPTAGRFSVSFGTRVNQAVFAIREVQEVIRSVREELADPTRLAEVKSATRQGFVFNFADPRSIVSRAATRELLEYPADFDETYLPNIQGVDAEGMLDAAKRQIRPADLVVVVVGKVSADEFAAQFTAPVYRLAFDVEPRVIGRVR